MSDSTKNAAVENNEVVNNENNAAVEVYNVQVGKVELSDKLTRVIVFINSEIPSYDSNSGDEISRNYFSISVKELAEQFKQHPVIAKAIKRAMGQDLNPLLFSYFLTGAKCVIERHYHAAGEPMGFKQNGIDMYYEKPTYTTKFTAFAPNWDEDDKAEMLSIIKSELTADLCPIKPKTFKKQSAIATATATATATAKATAKASTNDLNSMFLNNE